MAVPPGDVISISSSSSQSLTEVRPNPNYRKTRDFPYRLRQNTAIYLEDRQYIEGFNFLNNVLAAGGSTKNGPPAYAPFPQQVALAATLIVHPQFTTRAKSEDDLRVSDEALRFLRNVKSIAGPVNANLATAFTFRPLSVSRRRTPRRNAETPSTEDEDDDNELKSPFANDKSVFAQVDDFWQVVGWAFNCSLAWRKRWERWRLWLELVLTVLEDDWQERLWLSEQDESETWVKESLIMQYLKAVEGRSGRRRVMRAILADAQPKSMNEFGEVWKDETKERKIKEEKTLEHKMINLDEDNWGDYDIGEDEDEIMEDDVQDRGPGEDVPVEEFGGTGSIVLRQRLVTLLAEVAATLPKHFTYLEELFDLFTESIRSLPLSTFSRMLPTSTLPNDAQSALLTNMLLPFLAAPPKKLEIFDISQDDLIRDFLPFPANGHSAQENTKMSLTVEALLMSMWAQGKLKGTQALSLAVELGIDARNKRAIGDARKKGKAKNSDEQAAKIELDMSAERIMVLLEMLEAESGIQRKERKFTLSVEDPSSQMSTLTDLDSEVEDEDTIIF